MNVVYVGDGKGLTPLSDQVSLFRGPALETEGSNPYQGAIITGTPYALLGQSSAL